MDDGQLNREVARRLDLLGEQPELMMRYDSNGDGVLDREEWEVVRALVRRQVLDEFHAAREAVVPEPSNDWKKEPVEEDALTDEWGATTDPHIDLTVREQLAGRYDVLHDLGSGSQGNTYLGRDLDTNRFVAIKELAVGRLDDWKSIELFEREQSVLAQLDHPAIPAFVDAFDFESDGSRRFFLVQEFIDGETLEAELENAGHFRPSELALLADEVLEALEYLQAHDPPIVHRDIKPANIIRKSEGGVAIVDFGGVQTDSRRDSVGGSTIVGTSGYMPPEQLMGRSGMSTDLYALGATLVHLATGHHPTRLPQNRSKLDWRSFASLPEELADFIDRMIEPIPEDRFASAAEARRGLPDLSASANEVSETALEASRATWPRPPTSFVSLERSADALSVRIPARINYARAGLGIALIVLPLVAFRGQWAFMSMFATVAIVGFAAWNLFLSHCSYILEAGPRGWRVIERFWGIPITHEHEGGIVGGARVDRRVHRSKHGHERVEFVLQVLANGKWYDIEAKLSDQEKNWISSEIDAFAYDSKRARISQEF